MTTTLKLKDLLDEVDDAVYLIDDIDVTIDLDNEDLRDALAKRYREEVEAWNWAAAEVGAKAVDPVELDGSDDYFHVIYIGNRTTTFPSGKLYAPWTTNQSDWDMFRDEVYGEVLEEVAGKHGASVLYGAFGDGCDIHLAWPADVDLDDEEE